MMKIKIPKKPPPLHLFLLDDTTDSRNNRVMTQLRDSLLSQLTELHPTLPPSVLTRRSSFIQSRLQHLFHSFHTPTHPPYALMINKAIVELNDKNGSTEGAISEFVRREYDDLPWAHSKILNVHLKRLCQVGELVCKEDGRYVFPGGEKEKERGKGSRKRKTERGGSRRSNRLARLEESVETNEDSTQVSESDYHSIGSVEGEVQVQSEMEVQCLEESDEELEQDSQTQVGELACNEDGKYVFPNGGEEEKEQGKGSRKRKRGDRRSNRLALLDSVGTDEDSTQVSESDHHSIESVEEQIQVQSEKEVQCLEPKELEESRTQMVSNIICAEGSPEGIISTGPGIELSSPTQLQPQISADIDTDVTAAITSVNVDDDELPRDYNQENTNGNLDENPISECLELIQLKRKRGRPRKSEIDANCQEDSSLLKQGPKRNKKKQDGRGRPRKVIQDTEQCEEKLKKKEEKLKKKEENLKKKEEKLKKKDQGKLCRHEEKLKKKDQAQLHDREEKLNIKYLARLHDREEKLNKKDQAKLRGQGQGRGRGRGRGRGQGRHPKPKVCDTIGEAPPAEATAM